MLNLYSNRFTSLLKSSGVYFAFLFIVTSIHAEIIPFFNPLKSSTNRYGTVKLQGFIAEDPVSLKDFFDDWGGKFSPRNGDNVAAELSRIDLGGVVFEGYYVGYFYQRDVLINSNRGFTEGYHAVKNNLKYTTERYYDLELEIEGIERNGIVLSKKFPLYTRDTHQIEIAVSGFLSYAVETQHGALSGNGRLNTNNTYDAHAIADYRFITNHLYDGWDANGERDTSRTYGLGYGFHLGLLYKNRDNGLKIELVANDLFSRSYWKNLPYSHNIEINTNNQTIGEDGYVKYDPTVKGWEIYRDFTQKIEAKFHADIAKKLYQNYEIELGIESMSYLHMPYLSISRFFGERKIQVLYEQRFRSIGISYEDESFHLSILSNGFANTSAIGISAGYLYRF